MPPIANQFPSVGDWLFTYMDNFYDDGTTNYAGADAYYNSAISAMGGGPTLWSIGFLDIPLKFGRVYDQTNRDASWDNLRSWLESWNNRNLYYFGHGAPNLIGGDINTVDSSNNITGSKNFLPCSNAKLTGQWVASNVTKNKYYGPMPFRFVFLDGCDTAAGNWPAAWGVPNQARIFRVTTKAPATPQVRGLPPSSAGMSKLAAAKIGGQLISFGNFDNFGWATGL